MKLSAKHAANGLRQLIKRVCAGCPFGISAIAFFKLSRMAGIPHRCTKTYCAVLGARLVSALNVGRRGFLVLPAVSNSFRRSYESFRRRVTGHNNVSLLVLKLNRGKRLKFGRPRSPFNNRT